MWVLEGKCPDCFGNLICIEESLSLECEDCSYKEETKDKKLLLVALDGAEEWGPKDKRQYPSRFGNLILDPFSASTVFLRDTLEEAIKGLDLEEGELEQLKKYNLILGEGDNGTNKEAS